MIQSLPPPPALSLSLPSVYPLTLLALSHLVVFLGAPYSSGHWVEQSSPAQLREPLPNRLASRRARDEQDEDEQALRGVDDVGEVPAEGGCVVTRMRCHSGIASIMWRS